MRFTRRIGFADERFARGCFPSVSMTLGAGRSTRNTNRDKNSTSAHAITRADVLLPATGDGDEPPLIGRSSFVNAGRSRERGCCLRCGNAFRYLALRGPRRLRRLHLVPGADLGDEIGRDG